jgi:hypothetical protein
MAVPAIVHESVEFSFESGGAHITDCFGLGCTDVSLVVGPISGDNEWDVQEKVFHDMEAETTTLTYIVSNETLSPGISSFQVSHSGFLGVGQAPPSWTFSQDSTTWLWQMTDTAFGIEAGLFLPGFRVQIPGLISVGFDLARIGLEGGQILSSPT